MKGVFGIGGILPVWVWAIIALGITILFGNQLIGVASLIGSMISSAGASLFGQPASITNYQGCSLLLPEWGTYECIQGGNKQFDVVANTACGLFGITSCISITCNYPDIAETNIGSTAKSPCTITNLQYTSAAFISGYGGSPPELKSQQSFTIPFGTTILYTAPNGPLRVNYPAKAIYYTETSTGLKVLVGEGCDLYKMQGVDFDKLPVGYKQTMPLGSTQNYVIRWKPYPSDINTVTYNSQDVLCQNMGSYAILYAITKTTTAAGNCYAYGGSQVATKDCCPGAVDAVGRQCGTDFKWQSPQASTGCCTLGVCSDYQCAGSGGWVYDYLNQKRVRYGNCNSLTGMCAIVEQQAAKCNPATNEGCYAGQSCNPNTLECENRAPLPLTCLQAGYECCSAGMFASNIELRTCAEAGHADYVCNSGRCVPPTIPPRGCDIWCQITKYIGIFIGALIVMIIILAAIFITGLFVPAFQVLWKVIFGNWIMTLLIVLGGALLITWLIAPLAISAASMVIGALT